MQRIKWREIRERVTLRPRGAAGPFEIIDVEYLEGFVTPVHAHRWSSLHLVLSGKLTEDYAGGRRTAGPGSLLMYRAGVDHGTRVIGRARILHLPLYHEGPGGVRVTERTATSPDSTVYGQALRVAGSLASSDVDVDHEGERLAASMQALEQAAPIDARAQRAARSCLSTGPAIPLRELARTCGTSRAHLTRLFRSAYGCSVGQLVRRRQVAALVRMLLGGGQPLSEIALRAGFSDQSHMGRVFREHVGVTPGAFCRLGDPRFRG
jgi:AraC-like DNA-binding protein